MEKGERFYNARNGVAIRFEIYCVICSGVIASGGFSNFPPFRLPHKNYRSFTSAAMALPCTPAIALSTARPAIASRVSKEKGKVGKIEDGKVAGRSQP